MQRGTILNFSDFCVKFFVTIIQHFTWKHIIASDIKSFSKLKTIVSYFDHILLKRTWGVVLRPTIYVHNQYVAFLSLFRDILSNIIELTFTWRYQFVNSFTISIWLVIRVIENCIKSLINWYQHDIGLWKYIFGMKNAWFIATNNMCFCF